MDWLAGWTYRAAVTIDADQVGTGGVANFPVLLTAANMPATMWAQLANADGRDLRVTSSDGTTVLNHELVSITPATPALEMWVSVPSVASASDTTLYLYWGNSAATMPSAASQQAVWTGAGYSAVYHLLEDAAGATGAALYADATGLGHTGLDYVSATDKTGIIGAGQQFDGSNDFVRVLDADDLDPGSGDFTVSVWLKGITMERMALGKYSPSPPWPGWNLGYSVSPHGYCRWAVFDGVHLYPDFDGTHVNIVDGGWHHLLGTLSRADAALYLWVDNISEGSSDQPVIGTVNTAENLVLGARFNGGSLFWNGSLDEVRVATVARTAAWVTTEYNNQSSPGTFYKVGAAETAATGARGSIFNSGVFHSRVLGDRSFSW